MRAVRAICIKCGADKKRAAATCAHCKFRPVSDLDLAKSMLLSIEQFVPPEEPDPAWDSRMREAQRRLQDGQPLDYDPSLVQELLANKQLVESVPASKLVWMIFRLSIPLILSIAAIILMWWLRER